MRSDRHRLTLLLWGMDTSEAGEVSDVLLANGVTFKRTPLHKRLVSKYRHYFVGDTGPQGEAGADGKPYDHQELDRFVALCSQNTNRLDQNQRRMREMMENIAGVQDAVLRLQQVDSWPPNHGDTEGDKGTTTPTRPSQRWSERFNSEWDEWYDQWKPKAGPWAGSVPPMSDPDQPK